MVLCSCASAQELRYYEHLYIWPLSVGHPEDASYPRHDGTLRDGLRAFYSYTQNTIFSGIVWSRITSHLGQPRTNLGFLGHQTSALNHSETLPTGRMTWYIMHHPNVWNAREITLYSDCALVLHSAINKIFIFLYRWTLQLVTLKVSFSNLVMPGNCLFLFLAGELTAGLFILMTGYFKKPDAVICCMCVAGAAAGTVYAGFQVNMLDIAPRNASVVMGIVNAASNTAGFLSPMFSWVYNSSLGKSFSFSSCRTWF